MRTVIPVWPSFRVTDSQAVGEKKFVTDAKPKTPIAAVMVTRKRMSCMWPPVSRRRLSAVIELTGRNYVISGAVNWGAARAAGGAPRSFLLCIGMTQGTCEMSNYSCNYCFHQGENKNLKHENKNKLYS